MGNLKVNCVIKSTATFGESEEKVENFHRKYKNIWSEMREDSASLALNDGILEEQSEFVTSRKAFINLFLHPEKLKIMLAKKAAILCKDWTKAYGAPENCKIREPLQVRKTRKNVCINKMPLFLQVVLKMMASECHSSGATYIAFVLDLYSYSRSVMNIETQASPNLEDVSLTVRYLAPGADYTNAGFMAGGARFKIHVFCALLDDTAFKQFINRNFAAVGSRAMHAYVTGQKNTLKKVKEGRGMAAKKRKSKK